MTSPFDDSHARGAAGPDIVDAHIHLWDPRGVTPLVKLLGPHLRFVLDAFGPERCMFGSNFPMDAVSVLYGMLVRTLERTLEDAGLTGEARQAVLATTARRFYAL